MGTERKSVRSIKSISQLVDRRRVRTPAGAFLELSALAYEQELLRRELGRWERRHQEIVTRLAEIREKEAALRAVADMPAEAPRRKPSPARDDTPGQKVPGFTTHEFEY